MAYVLFESVLEATSDYTMSSPYKICNSVVTSNLLKQFTNNKISHGPAPQVKRRPTVNIRQAKMATICFTENFHICSCGHYFT